MREDQDFDVAAWLVREAFEHWAYDYMLVVVDFSHRELSINDIPPAAAKHVGPLKALRWFEFTAVMQTDEVRVEEIHAPRV